MSRSGRGAVVVVAAALMTTAVAAFGPEAAQAAPHYASASAVQVGYTDSATPNRAYDVVAEQDIPLGARVDGQGRTHVSRVYATFDVSAFAGQRIYGGNMFVRESAAADCTKRAVEVWRTAAISKTPTWNKAPARLSKQDEILTVGLCPGYLTLDVSAAVIDAVANGERTVSFEIRVPEAQEGDLSYGRHLDWYYGVALSVQYNNPPVMLEPWLYNGGFPCDTTAPYRRVGPWPGSLQAVATDADDNDSFGLTSEFVLWQQDDPGTRIELSDPNSASDHAATATIPSGFLVDGRTYSWQARVGDGADFSAWTQPCSFVSDLTDPAAPTVSSSDYPPEEELPPAPGEPGEFTFDGGGDPDVAGFQYDWTELPVSGCSYGEYTILVCPDPFDAPRTVRADTPGGAATVTLTPPSSYNILVVRAIDDAGNRSPQVEYRFYGY